MLHSHEIKVRYSEVDSQGIVFNANYLAYCDDAFESWLSACFPDRLEPLGIEVVVKRAVIEWHAPAGHAAILHMAVRMQRMGRTSFELCFDGTRDQAPAFSAQLTYVSVDRRTLRPWVIPAALRKALETADGPGAVRSPELPS